MGLTKIFPEGMKHILLLIYTQITIRKPIYKLPEYVEHTALKELLGIEKIIDKQLYNALEVAKRNHAMETDTYDPKEGRYMGYSLIFHTTGLSETEVVKIYYEKDIVEKAFKELKSSINLHPIRKYRMSHIKAHIKICYMAYALLTFIQYKLRQKNLSAVEALERLQSAYKVYLRSEKERFSWSKIVTLTKDQKVILKLLNCSV
mgnify:FL=1